MKGCTSRRAFSLRFQTREVGIIIPLLPPQLTPAYQTSLGPLAEVGCYEPASLPPRTLGTEGQETVYLIETLGIKNNDISLKLLHRKLDETETMAKQNSKETERERGRKRDSKEKRRQAGKKEKP